MADYFTLACNFSLTTVFFFCVFLKLSILTEAVDSVMTASLRSIPFLTPSTREPYPSVFTPDLTLT